MTSTVVGASRTEYDLVVIGAGSAAFAAAITASELGASVALLEANTVGGTCVNVGCVPSKAMLAAAEQYWRSGHHRFEGIDTAARGHDLSRLVDSKDALVDDLRRQKYLDLADAYGFTIRRARAELVDAHTVDMGDAPIRGGAIIVATGASPSIPPIAGLAEAGYLTSTTALELRELPRDIAIIGANAVGLEMGQLFLHLGSRVTFLEALPRITPAEEPEASDALSRALDDEGATVLTSVDVRRVGRLPNGRRVVEVVVDGEQRSIDVEHVLVATGRRPNTADLGLERAGVRVTERGAVEVDDRLRTSVEGIWAAGDVTGHPQFVYVAAHEGTLAARNAIGGADERIDLTALPRVIFTSPTIAAAGLTDEQVQAQGIDCECRVLPLDAVPRALVNRDTRGFVKIVAERATHRILGVTIVGDGAGEVIQAAVYAIQLGLTTEQIAATWAPYLTMAEGLKLAAQTFTRDVSKLSCCAA